MDVCAIGLGAGTNLLMLRCGRPTKAPRLLFRYGSFRGLVDAVDQLAHPRRPNRGPHMRIGRRLRFYNVREDAASRCERARLAPSVAVIENADDEPALKIHAWPPDREGAI